MDNLQKTKQSVLKALSHQEADEGLYFRNFFNMHEADERPRVQGEKEEIIEALNELIKEGKVKLATFDNDVIFLKA